MKNAILYIIIMAVINISCYKMGGKLNSYEPIRPDYWPSKTWRTSTPEEQGMDSAKLLEMLEYFNKEKRSKDKKIVIDCITIVRNGYIVADIYPNPMFPKDTKHIIHSCTKSIMSALIGIAIEEGYIKDVEDPVLDILNDKRIENMDDRMKALTIKDLLTMETGLHSQDSYLYQWRGLFKMYATDDWTEYALNLPMEVEPGLRFDYSNMSSFLLSAIITKTTGMDTFSFAKRYLFDPLEIKDIQWEKSPKGIYIGGGRMWLKPHDMAKIGLLYLRKGKWDNKQIIPAQWVNESTTAHSFPKKYRYIYNEENKVDYMMSGGSWIFTNLFRPFSDGYGYQWWIDKTGMYTALGVGGQYIMVVPQENLVVVFTSKLSGSDVFIPAKMLKNYILPAIVSNEPITANETAQNKLSLLSEPPSPVIESKAVQELSEIALEISGNTYSLESNTWKYDNFQLVFKPKEDYAEFNYSVKEKVFNIKIGLDNVYRLTESNENIFSAKGNWIAPDTFVIDYEVIGYSNKGKWTLIFDNDEIAIEEVGVTGVYTYKGKIK